MTSSEPSVAGVFNVTASRYDDNNVTDMNVTAELGTTTPSPWGRFGPIEQYGEFWAGYYINLYYLWVVFAVGFPGNIASFVTVLRMPPLTSSTGYVAALAVMDNLGIICKLLFHQLTLYDVQMGAGGCQVLYFFGSFFIMYANWILVAMSVERFIAIWFPLRVTTLCTGTKSILLMIIIAFVIIGADLHFLWTSTVEVTGNKDVRCTFNKEHMEFIEKVWYWIDGCLYAIIPCILLVMFNGLIILGIRKSRKIQKDLTNNKSDQMAEKYRQQRQITIMLIVVSIVFVVLVLPNCLFFIVKPYWVFESGSHGQAVNYLVSQLIFLLSDFNHAINFYLYFLTARRFRRRFTDTLCCQTSGRKPFTSIMRTANSNISNTSIYTTQTSMNGFARESGNNNSKKYHTTTT